MSSLLYLYCYIKLYSLDTDIIEDFKCGILDLKRCNGSDDPKLQF